MEQYNITGMSCAACQTRVEKAVSAVEGVSACSVSLLTNSMGVEGTADSSAIIRAVVDAGYGASLKKDNKIRTSGSEDDLEDRETPVMRKRLIASLVFLQPLMYVSMGHMMWNWPLPGFMHGNHIAMGLYELLLSGLIMVINQKFFISGFRGLIHRAPNMDTLVAMGATASFGYSVYIVFAMTTAQLAGDGELLMEYMDEMYFESAAMILTLITVGKMLEARSKGRTTDALKALMKLAPKMATVIRDGKEEDIPAEDVETGDLFVVKPGAQIPVDGIVTEGFSAVDESAFTGESVPVDKNVSDTVSAGTINTNGHMVCRATRTGEDTSLARVIQMVSDAAATKAPIAKIADKVSAVFVPAVITIAIITFIIWMLSGQSTGFSLARAISVLVISCPCALGLATPVAIMVGNGVGARTGILFKTAAILEQAGQVKIVALDKTGTVTAGQMQVTDIITADGIRQEQLLSLAASLEEKSEHPISRAIINRADELKILPSEAMDFVAVAGNGLSAVVNGDKIYGGNETYIRRVTSARADGLKNKANELAQKGKTIVYFATQDKLLGIIAVADVIKEDSRKAIEQIRAMGIKVVMLTGDNKITAQAIAKEAGIDEVAAGVKPDGKARIIEQLMELGPVAMVGDGINDAPALTQADVGIAIGAGTDIAMDAADIVLTNSSLMDVAAAIRLSRRTLRNIHENLFWAFIYNIIGIPLAAGCFIHAFGWSLNPMYGAAAMSLSSFFVVSNALRLNLINVYDNKRDKIVKNALGVDNILNTNNIMEDNEMKITVNGMMCPRCEAHVKKAVEGIEGVVEAVADHNENLVTITTSGDIDEKLVKAAVEEAGYEYAGVLE